MTTGTKGSRIDLRMTEELKADIATAAELTGVSTSNFIQAAATEAARTVIEQSRRVSLQEEAWEVFTAAIIAAPRPNPGLKDLLSRPSVFNS